MLDTKTLDTSCSSCRRSAISAGTLANCATASMAPYAPSFTEAAARPAPFTVLETASAAAAGARTTAWIFSLAPNFRQNKGASRGNTQKHA